MIGLTLYVALLVVLARSPARRRGPGHSLARAAVAACFVALLVDSFGYTGFAIDPAMWALLALGIALRPGPPGGSANIGGTSRLNDAGSRLRPAASAS